MSVISKEGFDGLFRIYKSVPIRPVASQRRCCAVVLDQKAEEADASTDLTVSQQRTRQQTPIFLEIIYAVLFAVLTEIGLQLEEGLDITGHRAVPLLSIAATIVVYLIFNRAAQEGSDSGSLSQTGLFRIGLLLLAFSLYSWVGKDPGFAAVLFLIMPIVYALSGPSARSKSGGSLLPLGLGAMMVVEFLLFEIQNPLPVLHKAFGNFLYYLLIMLMMLFVYVMAIYRGKSWIPSPFKTPCASAYGCSQ
jgi:hypothetical protein